MLSKVHNCVVIHCTHGGQCKQVNDPFYCNECKHFYAIYFLEGKHVDVPVKRLKTQEVSGSRDLFTCAHQTARNFVVANANRTIEYCKNFFPWNHLILRSLDCSFRRHNPVFQSIWKISSTQGSFSLRVRSLHEEWSSKPPSIS